MEEWAFSDRGREGEREWERLIKDILEYTHEKE